MGGAWEVEENLYRVLSRQAEGKRPLRRLQCSADNINTGLKEIGCKGMDWMNHSQDEYERWASRNKVVGLRIS